MAFDLLEFNGVDLRRERLRARRDGLRQLVGGHDPTQPIQFSEAVTGDPKQLLAAACGMELEGRRTFFIMGL
jgi:ATP-dependent DNA ligase